MSIQFNPKKLKKALIDRDLPQSYIAEEIGIAYSTINQIANGRRCRLETAQSIAEAIDVSLDELIDNPNTIKIEPTGSWSEISDAMYYYVNLNDLCSAAGNESKEFYKRVWKIFNRIELWEEV